MLGSTKLLIEMFENSYQSELLPTKSKMKRDENSGKQKSKSRKEFKWYKRYQEY